MGKSKNAQRTKGNVKPSNSGHSAELLGSSGRLTFIGFSNCKVGQHVAQNSDNSVDGAFSMVMKKMLKRDTTTKLKAVQEFRDLCVEKEKDDVLAVLAFWPRLYNKLAIDCDRRIREAVQEANAKLIEKVNRSVAPFLKNIMGVWLLAQSDLYPPAASVAQSSFIATFPEEKQSDALMFCKEETILFYKDNLFEQTIQTLSEPHIPIEEVEQKYVLLISGTLYGLKLLVSTISLEAKEKIVDDIKSIILPNKFWKLAKDKNVQIRVAWYNLISTLCHDMPQVFQNYESKLGCAVLGCLSESDPVLAAAIWEAALHFVAGFENCWENLDVNKVVLPELWTLLKEGGRGNASILFPCLLPFLSKLPIEIIKQKENFFPRFFSSITDSLFLDTVKKSTSECNAIVTAFMECLQYFCFNLGKDNEWYRVAKEILCPLLLSVVEKSFSMEGTHLPVSKFYPLLGAFVQCLEQEAGIVKSGSNSSVMYREEASQFWKGIFITCTDILNREHLPQNADVVFLAYFFHCMYEPSNILMKTKKSRVKFQEESVDTCQKPKPVEPESCVVHPTERKELFFCTSEVCQLICRKLDDKMEPHYMKLLVEIVSAARCCELFHNILKANHVTVCSTSKAPLLFFDHVILPWIDNAQDLPLLLSNVADVVFIICACLDKEASSKIINKCSQVDNLRFVERFLARMVSMNTEEKILLKWLKSSELVVIIIRLLKYVSKELTANQGSEATDLQPYLNTLRNSLTCLSSYELGIDAEHKEEILSIVKTSLEDVTNCADDGKHELIDFFCDVALNVFEQYEDIWKFEVTDKLIKVLLDFNLAHAHQLDENLKEKLHNLWLTCTKKLAVANYDFEDVSQLFSTVVSKLHKLVLNPLNSIRPCHLTKCIGELLLSFDVFSGTVLPDSEVSLASHVMASTLKQILPSNEEWLNIKKNLKPSLLPAFLEKKLFSFLPAETVDLKACTEIPDHIVVSQIVSGILTNCMNIKELREDNGLFVSLLAEQLPQLTWAFSYCETSGFLKKKDSKFYQVAYNLQKNCFKILAFLPKDEAVSLMIKFSELASDDPKEWLFPFDNTVDIVKTQHSVDVPALYDLYFLLSDNENVGNQLCSQMLLHHLPSSEKVDLTVSHTLQLLGSCQLCDTASIQSYATICCCLQESSILDSKDIQEDLPKLLKKVLLSLSSKDLPVKYAKVYSSQTCALVNAVLTKCPEILASIWLSVFEFSSTTIEQCRWQIADSSINASELVHIYHCCTLVCNLLSLITDDNFCFEGLSSQQVHSSIGDIARSLLQILFRVSDNIKVYDLVPEVIKKILSTLSAGIEFIPADVLVNCLLHLPSTDSQPTVKESSVDSLLEKKLLPLLTSNVLPLQLSAHSILTKFLPLVAGYLNCDDEKLKMEGDTEKFIRLKSLVDLLESLTEVVESMLSDVRISEFCVVLPDTDSYTYTMAFLFAWSEILDFFAASSSQERSDFVSCLSEKKLLSTLLACIFRLLPEEASALLREDRNSKNSENLMSIFSQPPLLSAIDPPTAVDLQHLACNAFYSTLKRMPAAIRTWCHSLDKRSFEAVNKFTTKYVSSLLAAKELQAVQERNLQLTNMTVQACPGSREVTATYTVDGYGIELVIQLPTNYPLGALNIERRDNVKLNQLKWRHWLMQLTSFLTYQNGSILDGLLLWKKNLDKTFEGIEECLICFFTLHSTTYELPKATCRTCRKKFHPSCIHKWFVTSNNGTCPMCRNLW